VTKYKHRFHRKPTSLLVLAKHNSYNGEKFQVLSTNSSEYHATTRGAFREVLISRRDGQSL